MERLARLARLELTDEQVGRFTRQLDDILEFARQVNAVDTREIDTGVAPDDAGDRMRDDSVRPSLPRVDALGSAPETDADLGLFKVPRVLNG